MVQARNAHKSDQRDPSITFVEAWCPAAHSNKGTNNATDVAMSYTKQSFIRGYNVSDKMK